jgi:tetratricopeptide (TPR) repeat protein
MVGREEELELVESLFERTVRDGRPHLVTVLGEAGVGKSRLLREVERKLSARPDAPAVRHGRCLAYGSGIVYWALGEVIRSELGIIDADDSDVAWAKLSEGIDALLREYGPERQSSSSGEQDAALIARLLGIETPVQVSAGRDGRGDGPPGGEDPQRMREAFFSATRSVVEAMACREPLVLAFEDIHWADQGMLDLIEYLGRWVHGPLLVLCLAREELLERRPEWGNTRRQVTAIRLDPLSTEQTHALVNALAGGAEECDEIAPIVAERAGGNPFFAEEMVRRLMEEETSGPAELPDTVHALLAARLDSLDAFERRLVQQAAVVGRTFWEGWLERVADAEGRDLRPALAALQDKDIVLAGSGSQLAGERELAFKHVLIRDVAYQMLPKAVRARQHYEVGRFIEERAGDRTDEYAALLADHYGRAARLGEEAGASDEQLAKIHDKALGFLETAGDAAASVYSNEEAFDRYQAAADLRCQHDPETVARIGEKQGDVALRMGRVDAAVDVWETALDYHRSQENLERVGDLNRKIGAALWHKGETKQAIQRYQKGINLLKDGPPCMELVHLYEEAASLYMHTGDNMLAIYASEKALRLAERLGETRAASRAHGIFGRVFGRIGDTVKARENLERSVELARESDRGETIRALLTLGYHLEISDAEYVDAAEAYREALELAGRVGDLPSAVELHSALARLATYSADWPAVRRFGEESRRIAEREGLVGKLSFPYLLRGLLAWREASWDEAEREYRRAHELAEQAGWSEIAFSALYGLALVQRDRGNPGDAVTALDQALDVCERAGLIAQSIQAMSARAITLHASGKHEQAAESADEAGRLAERLHYPVAQAAALEARGACSADPAKGASMLEDAKLMWEELGRPLDAAGSDLLRGELLREVDPAAAGEALEAARAEFERLGVPHLAALAGEVSAR